MSPERAAAIAADAQRSPEHGLVGFEHRHGQSRCRRGDGLAEGRAAEEHAIGAACNGMVGEPTDARVHCLGQTSVAFQVGGQRIVDKIDAPCLGPSPLEGRLDRRHRHVDGVDQGDSWRRGGCHHEAPNVCRN